MGRCRPHWISHPASPRCGVGWSAQQGFEGHGPPLCPLQSGLCQGSLCQAFGQTSFFFSNSTNGLYWLERETEKEGIHSSSSWAPSDLAAFRLARPFLLVGLSVPIGGSRFQASLAPTWEIKELTSHAWSSRSRTSPPHSFRSRRPSSWPVGSFPGRSAVFRGGGMVVYACLFWEDHLRFCQWKQE